VKLQKDGRVFANSALWPNSGRKFHSTLARTRPIKPGPTLQLRAKPTSQHHYGNYAAKIYSAGNLISKK